MAECHLRLKRKRRDFLHKLSAYYAREYDLVAVEDLNVKGLFESPCNNRNTASAAWNTFTSMLEYKCERERTSWRFNQRARPKSALSVVLKQKNRCGFVNTLVRRVGLKRTETRTRRGTSFLAVSKT